MNEPHEILSEKDKREIEFDLWRAIEATRSLIWTLHVKFGIASPSMRKLDRYIMDLAHLIEEKIKEKSK